MWSCGNLPKPACDALPVGPLPLFPPLGILSPPILPAPSSPASPALWPVLTPCVSRCHVCGLPLVSSPHLAASYHHLFPVPAFSEVEPQQLDRLQADSNNTNCSSSSSSTPWHEPGGAGGWRPLHCYACLRPLVWSGSSSGCGAAAAAAGVAAGIVLRCDRCLQLYCFDCDVFVHDVLHNCPGCECTAGAATVPTAAAVTTNGRT